MDNEPLRMGEVLVELGMLTPNDVYDALVQQVSEKIVGCFRLAAASAIPSTPWKRFRRRCWPIEVPSLEALLLAGLEGALRPRTGGASCSGPIPAAIRHSG